MHLAFKDSRLCIDVRKTCRGCSEQVYFVTLFSAVSSFVRETAFFALITLWR